jgi:hypothetical protein
LPPRCIPRCRSAAKSGLPRPDTDGQGLRPCTRIRIAMTASCEPGSTPGQAFAEPASASEAPAVIHLGPPRDLAARPKKARSGSEKRQRSAGILVKLTPADHQRVKTEAAGAGMSAAGYLASGRLGEELARRPRARRRQVQVDEAALLRALAAFNRASNNLNQTAHTGNAMMLFAEEHGAGHLAVIGRDLVQAVEGVRADLAPALAAILAAVTGVREG